MPVLRKRTDIPRIHAVTEKMIISLIFFDANGTVAIKIMTAIINMILIIRFKCTLLYTASETSL
jgi:hypothetical protein